MIYTTIEGTKFQIDHENKTWKRIDATGDNGNLRSTSGTFINATQCADGRLYLECPPLVPNAVARLVITSVIEKVEK